MRVAIIGHGPSMIGANHGKAIDSHDMVVRQKNCHAMLKQWPDDFGSRTDVVCSSLKVAPHVAQVMPGCRYWVFTDSRTTHVPDSTLRMYEDNIPCIINKHLCEEWDARYRRTRRAQTLDPLQEPKVTSDDLGHLHMSSGLHTLLYACEFVHPDEVVLYGFDNVKNGAFTWS